MKSDTFFSQVDAFQACLSCTLPCLFLMHCLCRNITARLNLRYRKSVAEKGGMNTGSACAEGRKRRQASQLVGLRRIYTCTPACNLRLFSEVTRRTSLLLPLSSYMWQG